MLATVSPSISGFLTTKVADLDRSRNLVRGGLDAPSLAKNLEREQHSDDADRIRDAVRHDGLVGK